MLAEYLFHVHFVGDAAHNGVVSDVGKLAGHHQADIVHGGFGLIDQNQLVGFVERNLAHHFRADAACRSCDQHAFARQHGANGIQIHLYFIAREEVFNFYLMQLPVGEVAFFIPFHSHRHHHHFYPGLQDLVDHRLIVSEFLRFGRRYQKHLDAQFFHAFADAGAV